MKGLWDPHTISANLPSPSNLSASTEAPDMQVKLVKCLMSGFIWGKREIYMWHREKSRTALDASKYSKPIPGYTKEGTEMSKDNTTESIMITVPVLAEQIVCREERLFITNQ